MTFILALVSLLSVSLVGACYGWYCERERNYDLVSTLIVANETIEIQKLESLPWSA